MTKWSFKGVVESVGNDTVTIRFAPDEPSEPFPGDSVQVVVTPDAERMEAAKNAGRAS